MRSSTKLLLFLSLFFSSLHAQTIRLSLDSVGNLLSVKIDSVLLERDTPLKTIEALLGMPGRIYSDSVEYDLPGECFRRHIKIRTTHYEFPDKGIRFEWDMDYNCWSSIDLDFQRHISGRKRKDFQGVLLLENDTINRSLTFEQAMTMKREEWINNDRLIYSEPSNDCDFAEQFDKNGKLKTVSVYFSIFRPVEYKL